MAEMYKSRFLKSIDGEYNYKILRYDLTDLRKAPEVGNLSLSDTEGDAPLEVTLEVTDTIPATKWAGSTVVYIDTDDGNIIEDSEGVHEYETEGVFNPSAVAIDLLGRKSSVSEQITVTEP